jgi:adenylate cyclase
MPTVYYHPDQVTIETDESTAILDTSLNGGIPHIHVCGGNARCSTCRVMVMEGLEYCLPRNEKETVLAERLCFTPDIRLACQTKLTGDVRIRRLVLDAADIKLVEQPYDGARPGKVGDERKIAILFSDIRNFTTFSEVTLPYDVIHILNRYFYEMDAIIERNGGYVDNYMGDGIMALFGTESDEDAALNAVRAGLEMLEAVEKMKPYIESLYQWDFQIGIGIHYGIAVIGTLSAANKRVSAIGDSVNFASRVESANKDAGTEFLISEETYQAVKDHVECTKKIRVKLKGKSGEHDLYEVNSLLLNNE